MDGHLEGVTREADRRSLLLLILGSMAGVLVLADVSGTLADDHYSLSLTLPWWGLVLGVSAVIGFRWVLRRRRTAAASPGHAEPPSEGGAVSPGVPLQRIAVRSSQAITLIDVAEISHVEADGRYTRIHAAGREHLSQHSLGELEHLLDGTRFVRVHRSAIVNLEWIRSLRTTDYRDFELRLEGGTVIRLSRTYRERLEGALGVRLRRVSQE